MAVETLQQASLLQSLSQPTRRSRQTRPLLSMYVQLGFVIVGIMSYIVEFLRATADML